MSVDEGVSSLDGRAGHPIVPSAYLRLVVLCSEHDAQPVVNTGTLYQ
ncbi:MAG: hypothetical protein ACHQ01_04200 [Candidatus Limnocylindrales bacterium]